jgi:hypothetical protein
VIGSQLHQSGEAGKNQDCFPRHNLSMGRSASQERHKTSNPRQAVPRGEHNYLFNNAAT